MGLFDNFFKRSKNKAKGNKQKEKQKTRAKTTPGNGGKTQPKTQSKTSGKTLQPSPVMVEMTSATLLSQVPGQALKTPARRNSTIDLERDLATPHLVPSSPVTNVYNKTYDCVAFLIHCPVHFNIGVAKSPTGAVWLPYVQKPEKMSWYDAASEGVMQVLADGNSQFETFRHSSPFDQMLLLEVARVQMPNTNKFVTRFTFYVRLKPSTESNKPRESSSTPDSKKSTTPRNRQFDCCVKTARLMWLGLDYISEGLIHNCWGPELVELSRQVMQASKVAAEQASPESTPVPLIFQQKLQELGVEQLFEILHRNDGPMESNSHTESLKQIKTSNNDIERLFNDFLDHSYPSLSITFDSFRHYMIKNNFETNELRLKRFFNAFNRAANGYLSFNELLMGLISIERETPHVEFRIKFVFDYYDIKSRGALNEEDFFKMLRDMNTDKRGRVLCSDGQIQRMARDAMGRFKTRMVRNKPAVTFNSFLNGVATHAFRGTSGLCRSKRNVFTNISRRIAARAIKTKVAKGRLANVVTKKNYQGSCEPCKSRKYKVASHMSIINLEGYCSDQMEALEKPGDVVDQELPPDSDSVQTMNEALSEVSLNFVNEPPRTESIAATMLMAKIRQYNEVKPRLAQAPGQAMPGLMSAPQERDELVKLITTLSEEIIPMLANETRCKPVPSPAFVIGDIHGNLEDLMSLERTIWRRFPEVNGMHYLFLGDYVDRGRWSVECALYLFAMKLLRPNNVTLLRGNHEVRDIQIKYTYRRECLTKYGERHGGQVWELSNRIFDHMPLCAVVDDNVFCAHGGIPHVAHTIAEINASIPVDLANPEHEGEVAWEIMWSDPMVPESFREVAQMVDPEVMANLRPGYVFNQKRGTAYYFNDVAANDFLTDNQLSHIIRAHEVPKFGFMFHFDLKCTTIFSCSHYCCNDNDCAVVFVDGSLMRVIRIDTASNVSATE